MNEGDSQNVDRVTVFAERLRELDSMRIGSWRWLSKWRRADRAARRLWIQVLQERKSSNDKAEGR
jgi:hypothetical protein